MRGWIIAACLTLFTGVIAGAFGAHALREKLTPEQLASFEVGVKYQMYHGLGLLGVAWVASMRRSRLTAIAGWLMLIGVAFFSGSIYGLSLLGWSWLWPVTPTGGTLLMIAWLMLAVAAARLPARQPGAVSKER